MDGSPVVEEQVGDNEAWDLLLFAIVDELTPHNLRRKRSICLCCKNFILDFEPGARQWILFPPSPSALSPPGSQCCYLGDAEGAWGIFSEYPFQIAILIV